MICPLGHNPGGRKDASTGSKAVGSARGLAVQPFPGWKRVPLGLTPGHRPTLEVYSS